MHDAIDGFDRLGRLAARRPGACRTPASPPARSAAGAASMPSQNASPSPGVCQILANACHSKSASARPAASVTHDRTRSGRRLTTRTVKPPPQSCPTRSTGPPIASSSPISHAAYSSIDRVEAQRDDR